MVYPPIRLAWRPTRESWELPVLFEDAEVLVLDKPASLLTVPDKEDPERPDLMGLLHEAVRAGASWARARGLEFVANVHRLDGDTTGALLLAKSKSALAALTDQLGAEKPSREYAALVQGVPAEPAFSVEAPIAPHPVRPGVMRVDGRRGKKAKTGFEVLERFAGYALLRCRPLTDRKHQIRVHLRQAGFPLAGDPCYGGRPLLLSRLKPGYRFKRDTDERPLLGRVALHGSALSFRHPGTGEQVRIEAPWPKDFRVALKYLQRYASVGGVAPCAAE
ncbi:MAG TPA: pseudouridine synthase [Verrucomicrobiota bacterium]|nr:pseudouridine synthase [Verrucomicrobiota bacterium]HNU51736.1 pseudouridine synthase [Verrucomicrobiota bacterium]